MKSLIQRIMTQAGIEPVAWVQQVPGEDFVYTPEEAKGFEDWQKEEMGMWAAYTEQNLYKACELVAREWSKRKDEFINARCPVTDEEYEEYMRSGTPAWAIGFDEDIKERANTIRERSAELVKELGLDKEGD